VFLCLSFSILLSLIWYLISVYYSESVHRVNIGDITVIPWMDRGIQVIVISLDHPVTPDDDRNVCGSQASDF
jgi:hypothetical protein